MDGFDCGKFHRDAQTVCLQMTLVKPFRRINAQTGATEVFTVGSTDLERASRPWVSVMPGFWNERR